MGFPERGINRVRVKQVESEKLAGLEEAVNREIAALETAGQTIRDVQFLQPNNNRSCSAFIVYNDEVGLDDEHSTRHGEWLRKAYGHTAETAEKRLTPEELAELAKRQRDRLEQDYAPGK